MADFPSPSSATPTHIYSMMAAYFPVMELRWLGTIPANSATGAWPVANQAIYIPFSMPHQYPVRRLLWANGSAAGGEWNAGIMTKGHELLTSTGKVAGAGNSAIQYAACTDILLEPGSYIFALAHSAVTANQANSLAITALQGRVGGLTQEAAALTLPNSGTPAKFEGLIYPLCGLTRTAEGF